MPAVTECAECGSEVEAPELDDDVLRDTGWHPAEDCPGPDLARAVTELHHQAHGPDDIARCQREPCSWLTTPQIAGQPEE